MSNHYAMEMSLVLYHEGEWAVSFTYYNHGAEPPYGGVRSVELLLPHVITLTELKENIFAIDKFIDHVVNVVKTIKPVPKNPVPDRPLEYSVELVGDELKYKIEMESMLVAATYDKTTEEITFAPRDAYDVSWQGFLFFCETIKDFQTEIERIAQ